MEKIMKIVKEFKSLSSEVKVEITVLEFEEKVYARWNTMDA